MAVVTHFDKEYSCTTAIKGGDYVHLLNEDGKMIVAFDGVTDFSSFSITGGSWKTPTPENECCLAVVKDDGTIGKGGHKCSEVLTKTDNAASATKLATARTIRTNLASTSTASFDGTANVTPGVTGILPIANGGTGAATSAAALVKLGLTATATELNYVDGVTSNIQKQLNRGRNRYNYFVNSDFINPINQRGNTSITTSGGYILDWWKVDIGASAGSVTWTSDNGVTLTPTSASYVSIVQRLERYTEYAWSAVTLAVQINGAWETVNFQYGHEDNGKTFPCGLVAYSSWANGHTIRNPAGNSAVTIQRVALYNGSYTADDLPDYVYKGYAAELAECQRVFRKIVNAQGYVSANNAYLFLPYTMRTTPTAKVNSIGEVRTQGQSFTPTSVATVTQYADTIRIALAGTFPAANHAATLFGADIELSADL